MSDLTFKNDDSSRAVELISLTDVLSMLENQYNVLYTRFEALENYFTSFFANTLFDENNTFTKIDEHGLIYTPQDNKYQATGSPTTLKEDLTDNLFILYVSAADHNLKSVIECFKALLDEDNQRRFTDNEDKITTELLAYLREVKSKGAFASSAKCIQALTEIAAKYQCSSNPCLNDFNHNLLMIDEEFSKLSLDIHKCKAKMFKSCNCHDDSKVNIPAHLLTKISQHQFATDAELGQELLNLRELLVQGEALDLFNQLLGDEAKFKTVFKDFLNRHSDFKQAYDTYINHQDNCQNLCHLYCECTLDDLEVIETEVLPKLDLDEGQSLDECLINTVLPSLDKIASKTNSKRCTA